MRVPRRPFLALLVFVGIPLAVIAIIPWAFHIGGRWTPLLIWTGSGTLVTKGGRQYPMFVTLYPAAHFSRLHSNDRSPTGGVKGSACLCTAPGGTEYLKIGGTIYNGWLTTDGSVMAFRLVEPTILDVGQKRAGYFDLMGEWHGPELTMDDRGSYSRPFRSGLRVEQASVTLHWHPFWNCRSECAKVASLQAHRSP